MKSIFGVGIAIVMTTSAMAQQQELKVKGIVLDNQNETVPYATINIHNAADSALVTGLAGNEDGSFEFSVPEGNYYIEISFFGMNNKNVKLNQASGALDLGKIALKAGSGTALQGVQVVADRAQMSLQIDKRVFNVGSDLNNQGANASEVLQNIPSVTVDAEGNVSLRGSQAVRVLIDGKLSGFASSAEALQQLQADMIDKIEIITNASARYEAQGEAGIINIILKKSKKAGFNGSANLRTGYYPDHGVGFNANYRKDKLNLYGSANYNYREVVGRSTTHQRVDNPDTAFIYDQDYKHRRKKNGVNANIGADYDINDKNTLTASVGIRYGRGNNEYDRIYDNYTITGEPVRQDDRFELQKERENMIEATLGYNRKFKKEGAEWKTELRFFNDLDFEDSDYDETNNVNASRLVERSNAYVTENMLLLQSDLSLPVSEKGKIEAGIRGHARDYDNKFGYSKLVAGDWVGDPMFNDRFNYREGVYAAYLMGSNTFGKLGVQAGLRAEYSEIYTRQYSNANGDTRDYLNFFPSLALSYKQSDVHTYQLSYSRRINRPGQWDLMPFMKFGDNRNMRVGNPDLDPELTDAYDAGVLNSWEKGSLLSSVYYRHTKNKFDRYSYMQDSIVYSRSVNIDRRDAVGLEFNANYNPAKWIRLTSGFNFFRETIRGKVEEQDFNYDNFSWTNRTSVNITLPQRWRFQLSGNYEAPQLMAQGKRLSMYFMDFAMSKDLMKNRATIGFNVSDLLNSRKWRSTVNTPEIQSETMFQWRQRSARITFTYRFNQQAKENDNLMEKGGGEEG